MTGSERTYRNGSTPTVLLVHGAFADASSWSGVIPLLRASGIDVTAPANPLRGLICDAAYTAGVAGEIDGPVLLAGHAYGGAVITVAGAQAGNVVGLVYVAAYALDEGESVLDVIGRFPQSRLILSVRPATFVSAFGRPRIELYIKNDDFAAVFAADLQYRISNVMAVSQRPIAAAAFEEKANAAAWKRLPSWYAVATRDQAIHRDAQRFMARRAGAHSLEVDASHATALSRPAAVAELIRAAALHQPSPDAPEKDRS
jgi:pimeloyl-ACP methyl ester carboxylesterase